MSAFDPKQTFGLLAIATRLGSLLSASPPSPANWSPAAKPVE
jgi:hypothetical protein